MHSHFGKSKSAFLLTEHFAQNRPIGLHAATRLYNKFCILMRVIQKLKYPGFQAEYVLHIVKQDYIKAIEQNCRFDELTKGYLKNIITTRYREALKAKKH